MLNDIRLVLQRLQELCQLVAVPLAHLWIAQDERVAPEFMKWNLPVGELLVPGWHSKHQRVSPDRFRNNAITDVGGVREPDREVA